MSLSVEAERPLASSVVASASPHEPPLGSEPGYQLIRRNRAVTPFDPSKIAVALTKAFLAVEGSSAAASRRIHDVVADLTEQVVSGLTRRAASGRTFHIEDVQDQVELALMRGEHHKIARAYVLCRIGSDLSIPKPVEERDAVLVAAATAGPSKQERGPRSASNDPDQRSVRGA